MKVDSVIWVKSYFMRVECSDERAIGHLLLCIKMQAIELEVIGSLKDGYLPVRSLTFCMLFYWFKAVSPSILNHLAFKRL